MSKRDYYEVLGVIRTASEDELKKALSVTEQRLAASETRISALEERVDFYEKLLEAPKPEMHKQV